VTGKDTAMMILAFLGGLILVTIIFGGSPSKQPDTVKPALPVPPAPSAETAQMVGLGEGYFVYRSHEDRFFLCRRGKERLEVVDVYTLTHKPPTYHAGVSDEPDHGWAFESMSRGKEAILEVRRRQFEESVASGDWEKTQGFAQEIAAVGGTGFLTDWLGSEKDWCGRRAAALALGQRGYVETVPVLADMILEGDDIRKKATELLKKLSGEDYSVYSDRQKTIQAYKKWYEDNKSTK